MLSLFNNCFSDKNYELCVSMCSNYRTYKVEVLRYRHAIRTHVITMYDIMKFYIDIFNWIVYALVPEV